MRPSCQIQYTTTTSVVIVFFILSTYLPFYTNCIDQKWLDLKHALRSGILKNWPFNFPSLSSLKTDKKQIRYGLENDGKTTYSALERIITKVVNGENVTVLVFGGSSTKGADLGNQNRFLTFHYAFYKWWRKVVTPITGSYMKREVLAVGGAGSTYFGHCWEEYLSKNESVDLVLWEFYINDPDSNFYGKGVEKFIRSVLMYKSKPGLIFVKFFKKTDFPMFINDQLYCPLLSDKFTILKNLSSYYSFTTIDLLMPTCSYLRSRTDLSAHDMFISIHPSFLAHAQLGYILIYYIRHNFIDMINDKLRKRYPLQSVTTGRDELLKTIKIPLYGAKDSQSFCWSAVLPDYRFKLPHHLFTLNMSQYTGMKAINTPTWDLTHGDRYDIRGGYHFHPGRNVSIFFDIKTPKKFLYVAISQTLLGGTTVLTVNNKYNEFSQLTFDCSRNVFSAMRVYYLGSFSPGLTQLSIATLNGACHLSAVIVE